jgi:hypothetical protein
MYSYRHFLSWVPFSYFRAFNFSDYAISFSGRLESATHRQKKQPTELRAIFNLFKTIHLPFAMQQKNM